VDGGGYSLLLRHNPRIGMEEPRKITEDLTQNSSSHSKTSISNSGVNFSSDSGLNSHLRYCTTEWFLLLLRN
jgi:hypothetical protein